MTASIVIKPSKSRGGKKARKVGRNAKWCLAYRNRDQREKNKAARLRKHLITFPDDSCAVHALSNLGTAARAARAA